MVVGLTTVTTAHLESMTGWGDMEGSGAWSAESTSSEGEDHRLRGPSSGVGCEILSDRDMSEQVHYFSEGRRLLLGV